MLVGDGAELVVGEAVEGRFPAGSTGWAQVIGRSASTERIGGMNGRLTRILIARFGARQGALALGRALPMGIGAGVGAVGNAALARAAIRTARTAFGPPPSAFPAHVIDLDVDLDPAPRRR